MNPVPQTVPGPLNAGFIEELYERYRVAPETLPADWRAYFAALTSDPAQEGQASEAMDGAPAPPAPRDGQAAEESAAAHLQNRVSQLVRTR